MVDYYPDRDIQEEIRLINIEIECLGHEVS